MTFCSKRLVLVVWLALLPSYALSQTAAPPPAKPDQTLLGAAQLEGLVAPIALYPDTLLAEVLMASTYPLEIVQAERWLRDRKNLKEESLKAEVAKQPWENSVKSLAALPAVLEMMSSQLDWTQKLGDAVLAQQADVIAAVQRLRAKAYGDKKLASTREQKVTLTQENSAQHIVIEPTNPDVISVPYYDPAVVYGDWPYPDDPPFYFPPPSYIPAGIITSGIAFGAGYLLGRWVSDGDRWGGGIRWGTGGIDVSRPIDGNRPHIAHWTHDRQHRHGVKYNNAAVRQRFGESPRAEARRNNAGDRAIREGANRPRNVADGRRKESAARRAGSAKSARARSKAAGGARRHASARPRPAKRAHAQSIRRHASFSRPGRRHASFGGGGRRFGGGGRGGFRGGGRRR
jgi:uncharacterized membrane protein YgcG